MVKQAEGGYRIEVKRPENWYPVAVVQTDRLEVPLVGLGDIHLGEPRCNRQKLKRVIGWIKDHEALWIGMGDWMENATRRSVGAGVYVQNIPPQEQIDKLVELIEPIAGLCIGALIGNHEERTYKETGLDPMQTMCRELGIPYFGYELYAVIVRNDGNEGCAHSLYATHSGVTNKTAGLALNAVERDWAKFLDVDLMCKAHGHDVGLSVPQVHYGIDLYHRSVTRGYRRTLLTGHFLERPGSYAGSKPYPPKPTGTVAVWMSMKKKARKMWGEELEVG
jgi:hypothetical protein